MKAKRLSLEWIYDAMEVSHNFKGVVTKLDLFAKLNNESHFFHDIRNLVLFAKEKKIAEIKTFVCERNWFKIDPKIFVGYSPNTLRYNRKRSTKQQPIREHDSIVLCNSVA